MIYNNRPHTTFGNTGNSQQFPNNHQTNVSQNGEFKYTKQFYATFHARQMFRNPFEVFAEFFSQNTDCETTVNIQMSQQGFRLQCLQQGPQQFQQLFQPQQLFQQQQLQQQFQFPQTQQLFQPQQPLQQQQQQLPQFMKRPQIEAKTNENLITNVEHQQQPIAISQDNLSLFQRQVLVQQQQQQHLH